ncbi:MAG: hypothetical protein KBF59_10375 [Ignavibacterium sp.]|nr:hypothetical protein [Ignavibacterium sp.]
MKLDTLFENLSLMKELEYLDFDYYPFSNFPNSINKLQSIKELQIRGSRFLQFPNIDSLNQLKILNLSGCQNINVDYTWKTICNLNTLERLDLNGMGIDSIPDQIINLKSLVYLGIGENDTIKYFSPNIFLLDSIKIIYVYNTVLPYSKKAVIKNFSRSVTILDK